MDYFSSSQLAPSSKKLYNTAILKWLSFTPHSDILKLIASPSSSIHFLQLSLPTNTPSNRHIFISAICNLLKYSHISSQLPSYDFLSTWNSILNINSEPIQRRKDMHLPTVTQSNKLGSSFSFQKVCDIRDSLPDSSIEKLLISFYTLIPSLRADLFSVPILSPTESSDSPNFIVLSDSSASLTITDFKSKKIYNKIHHPSLPPQLFNLLSISLKLHPRKFLFFNHSRSAFSSWASRKLSAVFHAKMTLTILRHIFVSSIDFSLPVAQLSKIGSLMGHSLATQKSYKWNNVSLSQLHKDSILSALSILASSLHLPLSHIISAISSLS
jgi:hypothetical protein